MNASTPNPAHQAMDDMAEHASALNTRGGFARIVNGLPHCTGPCRGGRDACTCTTGRVLRPGPAPRGLVTRLRRWWAAGKLRAEIAGFDADLADNELAQIALEHQLRTVGADPLRSSQLQLLRCEAIHLNRQRADTARRLADMGGKP